MRAVVGFFPLLAPWCAFVLVPDWVAAGGSHKYVATNEYNVRIGACCLALWVVVLVSRPVSLLLVMVATKMRKMRIA